MDKSQKKAEDFRKTLSEGAILKAKKCHIHTINFY